MSKIFFCADTHWGSQRTLELSRRPFAGVAEMDTELVRRWNKVVSRDDVVIHLGDFGDLEDTHRLKGREIYLVPGNYDTPEVLEALSRDPRVVIGVQGVALSMLLNRYNIPYPPALLSIFLVHEPERATDPEAFYLYGHIHQLQMVKRNGLNVGVDCHQFTPIDLATVKFYYDAITQHYDHNVFMPKLGGK